MSLLPATYYVVNEEQAAPSAAVPVYLRLEGAIVQEFLSTGADFRIADSNGAALAYGPMLWDKTNGFAGIFVKTTLNPATSNGASYTPLTITSAGGAATSTANVENVLERYPTDSAIVAQITTGSGSNIACTTGSFTGTTNATWSLDPATNRTIGFGCWAGNFTTQDQYLAFRATSSQSATVNTLWITSPPDEYSFACWLRIPTTVTPVVGTQIMGMGRYNGVITFQMYWSTIAKISIDIAPASGGNVTTTTLATVANSFTDGVTHLGDGKWHLLAFSVDKARGACIYVDDQLHDRDPNFQFHFIDRSAAQGTDGTTGRPIIAMTLGCLYDPRPLERAGTYLSADMKCPTWLNRGLRETDVVQLFHSMKMHPISTAMTKMQRIGTAGNPVTLAGSFSNCMQEAEYFVAPGSTNTLRAVVRFGTGFTAPGCTIYRMEQASDGTWGNAVAIIGQGTGGEANKATCPSRPVLNPTTGLYEMLYARGTTGLFQQMAWANSADCLTWTSRGTVTLTDPGGVTGITGNLALWFEGTTAKALAELGASGTGLAWRTYKMSGTGAATLTVDPTVYSSLEDARSATSGATLGSSGPSLISPNTDGKINGRYYLAQHGHSNSLPRIRHGTSIASVVPSPYESLANRYNRVMYDITGGVLQLADPSLYLTPPSADGTRRLMLVCDEVGTPSCESQFMFNGTPEELVRDSVRIEADGLRQYPTSATAVLSGYSFGYGRYQGTYVPVGEGKVLRPTPYGNSQFGTFDAPDTGYVQYPITYGSSDSGETIRTGTLTALPAPADADHAIINIQCFDTAGEPRPTAVVELQLNATNAAGYAYPGTWTQIDADINGVASCTCVVGERYRFRIDAGVPVYFTPTATGTITLTSSMVGRIQT